MSDKIEKTPEEKYAPAIKQAAAKYRSMMHKKDNPKIALEALVDAYERGDFKFIKTYKVSVLGEDMSSENYRAFRRALDTERIKAVRAIYEKNKDLFKDEVWQITTTAEYGRLDSVKCLYELGLYEAETLQRAFVCAAQGGHLEVMKYLREECGVETDGHSQKALRNAARAGKLEVLKYLHEECGVKIDGDDEQYFWEATRKGYLDIVKYLHENGVDFPKDSNSRLEDIIRAGHIDVYRYFEENGAVIKDIAFGSIKEMARYNRIEALKFVMERFDLRGFDGGIPILFDKAVKHDSMDAIKCLYEEYAQELGKKEVSKALSFAVMNARFDTVKYFHEQGIDITGKDNKDLRNTLMHGSGLCYSNEYLEMIQYIIDAGADKKDISPKLLDRLDSYHLWHKRHGMCLDGYADYSPYEYRPKAFYPIRAVFQTENHDGEDYDRIAYHAAALFKTPDRFLRYVERWKGPHLHKPAYELFKDIKIPKKGRIDFTGWADSFLKYGPKMERLFKYADQIPAPVKDENGGWSYELTAKAVAEKVYKYGYACPELAALCYELEYGDEEYEKALKQVEKYDRRVARAKFGYGRSLEPNSQIPDIQIDGELFDKPGYVFKKLTPGDPRGLLLGEFTNCCQHLNGVGKRCTKHGFTSPYGGFYVVEKEKTGDIVGQSWAWRGMRGELVLDSFERLNGHFTSESVAKLCQTVASMMPYVEGLKKPVTSVRVGRSGNTPSLSSEFNVVTHIDEALPRDYLVFGYRDSWRQYEVTPLENGL